MDANTGLTVLGASIGSAKIIEKVLGPTADYLGNGLKDFTQRRVDNVARIFKLASKFLGDSPPEGDSVHPRVLRDVLDNGSYTDDELVASYYGGILASSRSGVSRDDRGTAFTALVGRLTTYQLRAHYIFYRAINELYSTTNRNMLNSSQRADCTTFIPASDYLSAMQSQPEEGEEALVTHVLFGLHRETLIENQFSFGPQEHLKSQFPEASESGLLFQPSALGIELFLWATGNSHSRINAITSAVLALSDISIPPCPNAMPTKPVK